jgi:hypothetical protein
VAPAPTGPAPAIVYPVAAPGDGSYHADMARRVGRSLPLLVACALVVGCGGNAAPDWARGFEASFAAPPAASRPWVRWWWPGGSVDDAVLASEIARLDGLGFGGVEVQPFRAALTDDDVAADPAIATVGTAAQLAHVKAAAAAAQARGLAFSLTLGSGWPSGGTFSTDVRPRELLYARVDATGPTTFAQSLPVPGEPAYVAKNNNIIPGVIGPFDPSLTLVAVVAAPVVGAASPPVLGPATDVSSSVTGGVLTWDVPDGPHAIVAVYQHPVEHRPVAAAYPDPAVVVDHLDADGVGAWLAAQAGPFLDALAPQVPAEVFIDSPELLAELPWSTALADRFRADKGYDFEPFLPWLFRQGGEAKYSDLLRDGEGAAVFASADPLVGVRAREDYEDVRAAEFGSAYVAQVASFAAARGTKLRLQAHGGWGVHLDDYATADVPESEGLYAGGATDFLALAASAAHVAGRPVASTEAFVTMTSSRPLADDELWLLAGRAFGAGIQRLVHHGMPYPRPLAGGGHWYPFSGLLSFSQDFSAEEIATRLPAFNAGVTRLQWALTQGADRADVAWLLPGRQIPDFFALDDVAPGQYESETSVALRAAGFLYDRISPAMLAGSSAADGTLTVGAASYRALLLASWEGADPDALDAALRAAGAGVPVIVVGDLPTRARGLADAPARDARVADTVTALQPLAHRVDAAAALAGAFAAAGLRPALAPAPGDCPLVTIRHRETDALHVFFVFNEQATACTAALAFGFPARTVRALDPETGDARSLHVGAQGVSLTLPATRGRVLIVPVSAG